MVKNKLNDMKNKIYSQIFQVGQLTKCIWSYFSEFITVQVPVQVEIQTTDGSRFFLQK